MVAANKSDVLDTMNLASMVLSYRIIGGGSKKGYEMRVCNKCMQKESICWIKEIGHDI